MKKIFKAIKKWWNSYPRNIGCEGCHTNFYARFNKGQRLQTHTVKCPKCGTTGNPYFARCVGGYQRPYIGGNQ